LEFSQTKHDFHVSQGSVETLSRWDGKRYSCSG